MRPARTTRSRLLCIEGSPDAVLAVERARRRNRRSSRDRLQWDRELWDAYVRNDPSEPEHDDAA